MFRQFGAKAATRSVFPSPSPGLVTSSIRRRLSESWRRIVPAAAAQADAFAAALYSGQATIGALGAGVSAIGSFISGNENR